MAGKLYITSFLPDNAFLSQSDAKGFETFVQLHSKAVRVQLTASARQQLARENEPVVADMELYFSCLIRKRVLFLRTHATPGDVDRLAEVLPGLYIGFSPVTTQACRMTDSPDGPRLQAMPIQQPGRFVPDWLKIHFRSGQWTGEYGYASRT